MACGADCFNRKVLSAAGPGVAAADDLVQNHAASGIPIWAVTDTTAVKVPEQSTASRWLKNPPFDMPVYSAYCQPIVNLMYFTIVNIEMLAI